MPQSKPHESSARKHGDDDWEFRAVAIAVQLDRAAEELRVLVDDYRRKTREEANE